MYLFKFIFTLFLFFHLFLNPLHFLCFYLYLFFCLLFNEIVLIGKYKLCGLLFLLLHIGEGWAEFGLEKGFGVIFIWF